MATAKSIQLNGRQPSRWKRNALLLVIFVAGVALALRWGALRERAVARTAADAQAGCICRFVSDRPLGLCKGPGGGGTAFVRLGQDERDRSVTASVPLVASQTARFRPETGCQLEPWRG